MAGQQVHPTVGMLGMQGGFPPEGMPLSQAQQRGAVPQGMIGAPQFQGPAPVNGLNPNNWQAYTQPGQMQPQMMTPQQQIQPHLQQHPTVPYQPWEMPGYQQPPQQRPQLQQLAPQGNEVLNGPGVPLELRGRTFGQAMQLYTQLADAYLRQGRQQQPQQQQQQPQMQPQQLGQQQGQQQTPFNQALRGAVQEVVQQELAPIQDFTQRQAAQQAQQIAFQQIPDLQQIAPYMQQVMQGADPRALALPEFWIKAADLARGQMYREQMQQQQPQQGYGAWQQIPQVQQQQYYGQNGNGRFVPAGQQQFPQPTGAFFAEGPTPPMWGRTAQADMSEFGPHAIGMMQATGMNPEQYRAWQGGQQRQQMGRRW